MYTAKAALYLALGLSTLVLAYTLSRFDLLIFLLPLLTLMSIAQLMPPTRPIVEIVREVRPKKSPGDADIRVRLMLRNGSSGNIESLTVFDIIPQSLKVAAGSNLAQIRLDKGAEFSLDYSISAPPRGKYLLGPTTVTSKDALGLRELKAEVDTRDDFIVVPLWEELHHIPLRPRRTGVWPGTVTARKSGAGGEFYGLRDYSYGDEFRRINWKATARLGQLISNEFESERVTDAVLVVDAQDDFIPRNLGKSVLEYSVGATLSLATSLLRQGNRVGLIVHSSERAWLTPSFGRRQLWRIMDMLAEAKSGESQVPMDYVVKLVTSLILPPRSQILVISPLLGTEVLTTAAELTVSGYEVMVLSPYLGKEHAATDEWENVAYDLLMLERDNRLAALRRHCITLNWDVSSSLSKALKEAKRWKRMVSKVPTGRWA